MRFLCIIAATLLPSLALRASDIKITVEPVAGSETPFAVAEAVVDAQPEVVWEIVSRCNDYAKNMVKIAASKELERKGDESSSFTTLCEVTADLPFPLSDLVSVSRAVNTVVPGKSYQRKWTIVRGDYEINEGAWILKAIDDGQKTLVTYRLRAKPNIPLPASMLANFTRDTLPTVMKNLQAKAKLAPKRAAVPVAPVVAPVVAPEASLAQPTAPAP